MIAIAVAAAIVAAISVTVVNQVRLRRGAEPDHGSATSFVLADRAGILAEEETEAAGGSEDGMTEGIGTIEGKSDTFTLRLTLEDMPSLMAGTELTVESIEETDPDYDRLTEFMARKLPERYPDMKAETTLLYRISPRYEGEAQDLFGSARAELEFNETVDHERMEVVWIQERDGGQTDQDPEIVSGDDAQIKRNESGSITGAESGIEEMAGVACFAVAAGSSPERTEDGSIADDLPEEAEIISDLPETEEIISEAPGTVPDEKEEDQDPAETEDVSEEAGAETEEDPERVLTATGDDYTIIVTVPAGAGVPEGAVLQVTEIMEDTPGYQMCLEKAEKMFDGGEQTESDSGNAGSETETGAETETETEGRQPSISFARFFDVRIFADGIEIKPAKPLQAEIILPEEETPEDDVVLSTIRIMEDKAYAMD